MVPGAVEADVLSAAEGVCAVSDTAGEADAFEEKVPVPAGVPEADGVCFVFGAAVLLTAAEAFGVDKACEEPEVILYV